MNESRDRAANERAVFDVVEKSKRESLDLLLDQITAALHDNFPQYTGVYLYRLDGETLVLGPFRGRPTEHTRISIGEGVCGRAARDKATVTVDDVSADSEYIACSLETRSEIVVPIMRGDQVLGEIDIDSDVPAAFSVDDRLFLEKISRSIATKFP